MLLEPENFNKKKCKCSALTSPKTKDQVASPTFYPTFQNLLLLRCISKELVTTKVTKALKTYEPQDQKTNSSS